MNPFKTKTLEEFTIEDCQSYLESYPYGDNAHDVKKHLKALQKGDVKPKVKTSYKADDNSKAETLSSLVGSLAESQKKTTFDSKKPKKNRPHKSKPKKEEPVHRANYVASPSSSSTSASSTFDKILSAIGWIVAAIVVVTIIIVILDAIMPEGTGDFIRKYRYVLYPLGMGVAKLFDKNK